MYRVSLVISHLVPETHVAEAKKKLLQFLEISLFRGELESMITVEEENLPQWFRDQVKRGVPASETRNLNFLKHIRSVLDVYGSYAVANDCHGSSRMLFEMCSVLSDLSVNPYHMATVEDCRNYLLSEDSDPDKDEKFIRRISDAMDDLCPEGYYFGLFDRSMSDWSRWGFRMKPEESGDGDD